jgi:hypothetical protein
MYLELKKWVGKEVIYEKDPRIRYKINKVKKCENSCELCESFHLSLETTPGTFFCGDFINIKKWGRRYKII